MLRLNDNLIDCEKNSAKSHDFFIFKCYLCHVVTILSECLLAVQI